MSYLKNKRILGIAAATIGMIILITIIINSRTRLNATIPGEVIAENGTKVYKKASTDSKKLKKDKKDITLVKGTTISIIEEKEGFYYISFTVEGDVYKGYAPKNNIKELNSGESSVSDSTMAVGGDISDVTLVYTLPSSEGSVTINKDLNQEVVLKEGDSINIISATYYMGVKWYKIVYANAGNPISGYIPARFVNVRLDANASASIYTNGFAIVETEPGTGIFLTVEDDALELKHETEVEIIESEVVNEYRYDKIRVEIEGNEYTGYVADDMIKIDKIPLNLDDNPTNGDEFGSAEEEVAPRKTPKKKAKKVKRMNKKNKHKPLTNIAFRNKLKREGFPDSYIEPLVQIHEQYPYWEFEAFNTGLDFNDVVAAESKIGLNLVTNDKPDTWKSKAEGAYNQKTKTYIPYDGGKWVNVNETVLRYYLDPRNFLNSTQIFQFENLSYQSATQNVHGIENMLKGTPMYQTSFNYKEGGKNKTISYGRTFLDAAKKSGVSPYHLVARVKQEVVTSPVSFSSSVSNTSGYYNFYNIGASNSNVPGGAISKGLAFAAGSDGYFRPWNNRYRAIVGGGMFIGQNYINVGQDTLYLQKFNVTDTATYGHQYMGNIEAPASEAVKTVSAYGGSMRNMNIVFSIPVYSNMPIGKCPAPKGGTTYGSVQVSVSGNTYSGASSNNDLNKIIISAGGKKNTFTLSENSKRTYRIKVEANTKYARLNAKAASSTATVSGTGRKRLSAKKNIFYISCKSESGSVKKYKIIIIKKTQTGTNSNKKPSSASTRGSVSVE
ncbi:MAG: hypothetical protein K6D02_00295 [Lachnospiraceae bacterium]|nr:hypothetical protein [Lachnospiraceae bacterium]